MSRNIAVDGRSCSVRYSWHIGGRAARLQSWHGRRQHLNWRKLAWIGGIRWGCQRKLMRAKGSLVMASTLGFLWNKSQVVVGRKSPGRMRQHLARPRVEDPRWRSQRWVEGDLEVFWRHGTSLPNAAAGSCQESKWRVLGPIWGCAGGAVL